jgi:hypothetical protein
MTKKKDDTAEFDFAGAVTINGPELNGTCDTLGILADVKKATGAVASAATRTENLARIHNLTAIGHVRLATADYIAQGGEAVILPRVALEEKSPRDDNGLDGHEPQFLTLRPHTSTPALRTRLTLLDTRKLKLNTRTPATAPTTPTTPTAPDAAPPIHIDSDLLEIIGGAARSRFFLRGDVILTSEEIRARCDRVEGSIVQEKTTPADGTDAKPDYTFTRIIGYDNITLVDTKENRLTAQRLEVLPRQRKARLSGNPVAQRRDGTRVAPGKPLLYDLNTRDWAMETNPADGTDPTPITQPSVRFPLKGNWRPPKTRAPLQQ